MCPVLKKDKIFSLQKSSWQPSASHASLKKRAAIMAKIRTFFDQRKILEVETPLLSLSSVTDPNIQSFQVIGNSLGDLSKKMYLQPSPEYAMKRLLASYGESIYQICKAFRTEECGRLHQPEFTLLEWYRLGFDHHDLMNEVDEFLFFYSTLPKLNDSVIKRCFYTIYLAIL